MDQPVWAHETTRQTGQLTHHPGERWKTSLTRTMIITPYGNINHTLRRPHQSIYDDITSCLTHGINVRRRVANLGRLSSTDKIID